MAWSFRVTTYNVLAEAYASRKLFAAVDPEVLSWKRRGPAIVARVAALEPDLVCLQEVQASHWPDLRAGFAERGWHGSFAQKGQSRPDGCAILCRSDVFRLVDTEVLYFNDGEGGAAASGHLALIGLFDTPAGFIRAATTHLRWQASTSQAEEHIGYRQAVELAERCRGGASQSAGMVLCGDFNVPPASPVIALFQRQGLVDAYATCPQFTCNPNGHATRIDYIFATENLLISAEPISELGDHTVLPNLEEPSDHLPITATLGN